MGGCVSPQRPHPILTPLLQAARKDAAGRGRLGSDTPLSRERLPAVITPLPLLSLSDLTLNTGPSPAETGLDGFAGFYRRLRDPRRDVTRVTDNCPRHGAMAALRTLQTSCNCPRLGSTSSWAAPCPRGPGPHRRTLREAGSQLLTRSRPAFHSTCCPRILFFLPD